MEILRLLEAVRDPDRSLVQLIKEAGIVPGLWPLYPQLTGRCFCTGCGVQYEQPDVLIDDRRYS